MSTNDYLIRIAVQEKSINELKTKVERLEGENKYLKSGIDDIQQALIFSGNPSDKGLVELINELLNKEDGG